MLLRNTFIFIAISIVFFCHSLAAQITVQGVVSDTDTAPVAGALVELSDLADNSRVFSSTTDSQGHYSIQITASDTGDLPEHTPNKYSLLQNYPNPFNPTTVISYEIPHPAHVRIEIYNVLGQKVRTLSDDYRTNLYNRVIWDGTNDQKLGVAAGVYIYSLITDECRINRKMLILDGHLGNVGKISGSAFSAGHPGFLKAATTLYKIKVNGPDIDTYTQQNVQITANTTLDITVHRITTLTDIDGNVYKTVKIGDQLWMAENLKVTHYRNGDPIPKITDGNEWSHQTTGAYCYYDNNNAFMTDYGALYNWYAVKDERNIAPEGWHVPDNDEWLILVNYLGGSDIAGGKMKEAGNNYWESPNTGATNSSGFTAMPGGYRESYVGYDGYYGYFYFMGTFAYFWSATDGSTEHRMCYDLSNQNTLAYLDSNHKPYGLSVRLVRDVTEPKTPNPLTPVNEAADVFINPTLTWNNIVGANYYNLQVAKSADFSNLTLDLSGLDTTLYQVTGLDKGTTYYWRVSATYPSGASSWSVYRCFTVYEHKIGTLTDIDGNIYKTIKIGNRIWMAENLKVTHYRNGDPIPNVTDSTEWVKLNSGAFCYYDNNSDYAADYGALYNWYAVNDKRKIAPEGWHVPTRVEWQRLVNLLEGNFVAGGYLKEVGTEHWTSPNRGASNITGFTARPGGFCMWYRNVNLFSEMNNRAYFLSSHSEDMAWGCELYFNDAEVDYRFYSKITGGSVRLIRD